MVRETMKAHHHQESQFGQVENALGLREKDDDLVAVLLLEPQAPACGALYEQQYGTQAKGIGLYRRHRLI